jgi:hypothetical protein
MLYSWICELASHNNEIGNKFIHTLYIFINVGRAESVIRRTDPIPLTIFYILASWLCHYLTRMNSPELSEFFPHLTFDAFFC